MANNNAVSPLTATVVVGEANQDIVQDIVFGTTELRWAEPERWPRRVVWRNARAFASTTSPVCTVNVATVTALTPRSGLVACQSARHRQLHRCTASTVKHCVGSKSDDHGIAPTTHVVFGAAAQTVAAMPVTQTVAIGADSPTKPSVSILRRDTLSPSPRAAGSTFPPSLALPNGHPDAGAAR